VNKLRGALPPDPRLGESSQVVYLIGHPVSHSLSPAMQNAAFAASGLPHRYEPRDVDPADLEAAVRSLRTDAVLGANVTVPHKERILSLLDAVAGDALRIGAVNTILREGTELLGENTDRGGFEAALRDARIDVAGKRVLVLGAGGAARAIVIALAASGARVDVANRTPDRARRLADAFGVGAVAWPDEAALAVDVIVNATSAGLHGEDPLAGMALPAGAAIVDIVPTAAETPLARRAREAGNTVVDGLLMLLHQAAASFHLWTGRDAPLEAMRAALPRRV